MKWRMISLALIATASGAVARPVPAARRFTSHALGLAMDYPPAWHRIAPDPDTLSLVRPDMSFRGPIQPRGQARITVGPSAAPGGSAAAVIRFYAAGGRVRMEPAVASSPGAPCPRLAHATIRQEVVPAENRTVAVRAIRSTILVCTTPAATVVGTASAWAGDPHVVRADRALLAIMRSLVPVPPPSVRPPA